jgi:hypothetical protein
MKLAKVDPRKEAAKKAAEEAEKKKANEQIAGSAQTL